MTLPLLEFSLAIAPIASASYLGICLALRAFQHRLIFVPCPTVERSPDDLDVPYEEVRLPAGDRPADGYVYGWWLPNADASLPTLLYLHGNGGNVGTNLTRAVGYRDLGFSVLLIDYRGYGRSPGPFPCERQVYADAELAWTHLVRGRQRPPENIYLYGHSLGGAIAIELAMHHPELAGAIVEGSFTSMLEMARATQRYRWLPLKWLVTQHFNSVAKLPNLNVPLLFVHGAEDDVVPAWMSKELHAVAPPPKTLLVVPDADHINVPSVGGETYLQSVRDFIARTESSLCGAPPVGNR
ncbi:prolyl oligopeptidase family [Rubidibacter lacunae KORDI 51-2]|uniref:Prolyl oligopeptidase family n=1 Tax=Rubidibacter lacunae KORDI 51-2 TaxID=582515 RepID=U5DF96_9CHRO|nr:alpha/beta hydrolase [Rubidibacter lacunae]ERN39972.1 prolyl oligopeptidase family [Rubidibacter lacunae KORDI 51-2]